MRSHAARGYSCFASDVDLKTNLKAFMRRAAAPAAGSAAASTPLALFASVEDPAILRGPALRDFNLSSLASLGAVVSAARREHGLTLPDGIAAGPNTTPLGSARARLLRLLGARLAALGSSALPGRGVEALVVPPLPRARDLAAQLPHQVTDSTASGHPGIATVLFDQLTCARAQSLLLNAFSTYSQLIMGRVGMQHAGAIGWTRDLTPQQQRRTGVSVEFWQTQYWATRYRYILGKK